MNDPAISEDLLFGGDEGINEFLSLMGLDPGSANDVIQDDGSLILAIGDRALSIEQQSSINGVVIMVFITDTTGLNVDAVLRDLMVLNARPQDTGGLIFGLLGSDVIVGTLIVPQPYASPRTVADAVEAINESTDIWRTVIEDAVNNFISDAINAGNESDTNAPVANQNIKFV